MRSTPAIPGDEAWKDCILRCRQGDTRAFGWLVEQTQHLAYALAVRMMGDEDEARDVVQESFVAAWKHMHSFDENRKFSTWLYAIVSNRCLDQLRRRRRLRLLFHGRNDAVANAAVQSAAADTHVEHTDLIRHIRRLTGRLSPSQRLVFVLRDLQQLEVREVREITGLSADSIKTHLSAARRKLRHILKEEYGLEGQP